MANFCPDHMDEAVTAFVSSQLAAETLKFASKKD